MSAPRRLIAAALAVRDDVRGNANVYAWACMWEQQSESECRLAELDAALREAGADLPELQERQHAMEAKP